LAELARRRGRKSRGLLVSVALTGEAVTRAPLPCSHHRRAGRQCAPCVARARRWINGGAQAGVAPGPERRSTMAAAEDSSSALSSGKGRRRASQPRIRAPASSLPACPTSSLDLRWRRASTTAGGWVAVLRLLCFASTGHMQRRRRWQDEEGHNGNGRGVPALFPLCLARRRSGQHTWNLWVRGPHVFP
jgi:hypothetical protein